MEEIKSRTGISGSAGSLIGGRRENQDSYGSADTPLGLLVVVCDGMGGGPAGKTASENAVEAIIAHVMGTGPEVNIPDMLAQSIHNANSRLIEMQRENPDLIGMGTTAVVLLLTADYAYIAHVGDSRLYQLRGGKIAFRTADHSFVGELVRKGTITEEQARTASNSNIITRAVGIRPDLDVELDTVQYRPGDRFALMSDGIWGAMPESELVKLLAAAAAPGAVVDKMVRLVDDIGKGKGGMHDNLTLAIVDIPTRKAVTPPSVTPPPPMPAPAPMGGQTPMPAPAPGFAQPAPKTAKFNNVRLDDEDDLGPVKRNSKVLPKVIAAVVVALIIVGVAAFFWWDGHKNGVEEGADEARIEQEENVEVREGDQAGAVGDQDPSIKQIQEAVMNANQASEKPVNNENKESADKGSAAYDESIESIISALDDLDNHGADDDFKWDNKKYYKQRQKKRGAKVNKVIENIDKSISNAPPQSKQRLMDIRKIVEKNSEALASGFDANQGRTTKDAHRTIETIRSKVSALKTHN